MINYLCLNDEFKMMENEINQPGKKPWRVLPFKIASAAENMGIDEAILLAKAENFVPNTIRFYRWNPSTASIGSHQSLEAEIDLDAAAKNNVDVVRRISGGGAVFHGFKSEITYSVIANESDIREIFHELCANTSDEKSNCEDCDDCDDCDNKTPKKKFFDVESSYNVITAGLANGLKNMGVKVDQGVIHCPALFINNKKISGNAQARRHGVILQHGTILLHVDPEFMYTILRPPAAVTKSKMVQSVRAKVAGIFDEMDEVSNEEFQVKMIKGFEEVLGIKCEVGELSNIEKGNIEDIITKRYKDDKWLKRFP